MIRRQRYAFPSYGLLGYQGFGAAGPTGGVAQMTTSQGPVGTNYSGGYDAYPGDSWSVSIIGAPPNVPVIREHPIGATGVQVGTTDGKGNFSTSGTFGAGDVGQQSDAWSSGGWASGTFHYTIAPALGGSSGGPYGPRFDQWYQGGGYYNTLAMDPATYAAFDAARNAGPRVAPPVVAPPGSPATPSANLPPIALGVPTMTPQGQAIINSSGVTPAPSLPVGYSPILNTTFLGFPVWGWLAGGAVALFAFGRGK